MPAGVRPGVAEGTATISPAGSNNPEKPESGKEIADINMPVG
jgi:hypothetical protein